MNYTPQNECIESIIKKATMGLAYFMYQGIQQKLESIRLARAGYALLTSGCSVSGNFPGDNLSSYLVDNQQKDGGWADVEETLWCLAYLNAFGERYDTELANGGKWLTSVQLPCGAWGKSERDQPRIPVTALASVLVPDVLSDDSLRWLKTQWEEDIESPTQLTYKGAYFLLTSVHIEAQYNTELMDRTLIYLNNEQEKDGGFGPWKGHPIGSDPWSTGIALWGLSKVRGEVPKQTIERALSWLSSKQLPNGLWPYHYLDDGTAMALIGIASNSRFLME